MYIKLDGVQDLYIFNSSKEVNGWEQYLYKVGANPNELKSYKISRHQPDK